LERRKEKTGVERGRNGRVVGKIGMEWGKGKVAGRKVVGVE
jgi:hypothetical protein